ncbi:MAG: NAD(P)H-dependent oxidoreductase [Firmicutes bacterium]|nr:NAD(P)H-dependent oxidoreductase [Bacillota bacterium]
MSKLDKKVLILDGRLRQGGNTDFLLQRLLNNFDNAVGASIARTQIFACTNCEACLSNSKCIINDDMQTIYHQAKTADFVVLASPIIFGNLSGRIIDILSRLQCYFKGEFNKLPKVGKVKQGAIILIAGGSSNNDVEFALKTAKLLLKILNVENPTIIASLNTDKVPTSQDKEAIETIDKLLNSVEL